jgi:hypothetical protein
MAARGWRNGGIHGNSEIGGQCEKASLVGFTELPGIGRLVGCAFDASRLQDR